MYTQVYPLVIKRGWLGNQAGNLIELNDLNTGFSGKPCASIPLLPLNSMWYIPIASLIVHGSTFLFRGLLMSLEGTNYLRIAGWNFGAWRLQRCCAWMNRPTFWTLKPPPGSCWWSGAGNKAWLMWLLLVHGSGESVVGYCWRIINDSVLCLLMG